MKLQTVIKEDKQSSAHCVCVCYLIILTVKCWIITQHTFLERQNYIYYTYNFYKGSAKADIKSRAIKAYLAIPDSQLSLNKEGAAESSSWSASCLNRLPGRKLSTLSALEDGGVCRKKEKKSGLLRFWWIVVSVSLTHRRCKHLPLWFTDRSRVSWCPDAFMLYWISKSNVE